VSIKIIKRINILLLKMPKQLSLLNLKPDLAKPQKKLVEELETFGVSRQVSKELVRASHLRAIKKWIALIKKNRKLN
jgi:hypothetical protein